VETNQPTVTVEQMVQQMQQLGAVGNDQRRIRGPSDLFFEASLRARRFANEWTW
jgi:hypothetical protein